MKMVIAGFHTAAIRAIESLVQWGTKIDDIALLTHDIPRNQTLLAYAASLNMKVCTAKVKSEDYRKEQY